MEYQVTICNWGKYNPKQNQKSYTWFRLNNNVSINQDLFGLDAEQKFCWIEILCQASQRNSALLTLNIEYISHVTGVKSQKIISLLEFLERKQILNISNATVPVDPPVKPGSSPVKSGKTGATNVTYVTYDTNINLDQSVDRSKQFMNFSKIYEIYPRKIGKEKGLRKCKDQIKTQEDYDALANAVYRYKAYCERERLEPKFIKHFSSFMTDWRDWLDAEVGSSLVKKSDAFALIDAMELGELLQHQNLNLNTRD